MIRKMKIEDVDEVVAIASSPLNPWTKNMLIEEITNTLSHCFVMQGEDHLEESRPILGFICFRNIGEESELLNICVHSKYRQMGLGKKLIEFYLDFCHPNGIKIFYLEVSLTNLQAIHLYQSFSYQSLGRRRKFYQGEFDALLMMRSS